MAPRARGASTPAWIEHLRKHELLIRDPLYQELTRLGQAGEDSERGKTLRFILTGRYGPGTPGVKGLPGNFDTPADVWRAGISGGFMIDEGLAKRRGTTTGTPGLFGPVRLLEPRDLAWVPPRLHVHIQLDLITLHDLEQLTGQFRAAVKKALATRPASSPLRFLTTTSEATFARDLRRYDLHMERGLTFRQIAWLEAPRARGKQPPRQVAFSPKGESSVRASVARLYEAIHREPYRARRQRLDGRAGAPPPYDCPDHGVACDQTCPHLLAWAKNVEPYLPAPHSGS